jgi:acetyl-CoA carboxylase carboxyl transferase subunit beta
VNWINNVFRPKITSFLTTRREPPEDFWRKCGGCGQMSDRKALEENKFVFPCCGHHDKVDAAQRLRMLFDKGEYKKIEAPEVTLDPLKFRDGKRYIDRLKEARAKTGETDAVVIGEGLLEGRPVVAAVQDFRFMAGSLGMAAGEAVVKAMLHAVDKGAPMILFAASGGARMQEGILSLMQMPRTTIAVQRLRSARLPYIVVLTDPTTGGVTASYAMLGDVQIAEPGALICFAGPRVIQQTIREQLPEGFQRAEYLLAHGMIDIVVHRHKLRETLAGLVGVLMNGRRAAASAAHGRPKPIGYIQSMNGHAVDGKLVESLARGSGIVEPESSVDQERFTPAADWRTGRADAEGATSRATPKEPR